MEKIDAETLDYEEVLSELYSALEADLSTQKWPERSKSRLNATFLELEALVDLAGELPNKVRE